MTRKFYHAQNANRSIAGQVFTVYDIVGGSAWGVFFTDNDAIGNALDAEVAKKNSPVTSITEHEYESAVKKKLPDFAPSTSSVPASTPPNSPSSLKGTGATIVSEDPVEVPVKVENTVETAEDALKLGEVKPVKSAFDVVPVPNVVPAIPKKK